MNSQRVDDISTIFTHSSDGLVLSDREGRMLRLNPAFRRVSGIPHKLALGHNVKELLENGTLSASSIARVVETGKPQPLEQSPLRKSRSSPLRDPLRMIGAAW